MLLDYQYAHIKYSKQSCVKNSMKHDSIFLDNYDQTNPLSRVLKIDLLLLLDVHCVDEDSSKSEIESQRLVDAMVFVQAFS